MRARGNGARVRVGYDVEDNDRADPGVSPVAAAMVGPLSTADSPTPGTADAALCHRTSRYGEASVPRDRAVARALVRGAARAQPHWMLSADYRWFDNDSTVDEFTYDGQRVALGLSRSFYGR